MIKSPSSFYRRARQDLQGRLDDSSVNDPWLDLSGDEECRLLVQKYDLPLRQDVSLIGCHFLSSSHHATNHGPQVQFLHFDSSSWTVC